VFSEFLVEAADLDEGALTVADPWETASGLALAKARLVASRHPDALVIGGDTVVAFEFGPGRFEQLAKPRDVDDAEGMLARLSGRSHVVITGLALVGQGKEVAEADTTTVWFRDLDPEEIVAYVATGEPMDKAGAYAIQGGAAGFIEATEGSISNVIGLPLELLARLVAEFS